MLSTIFVEAPLPKFINLLNLNLIAVVCNIPWFLLETKSSLFGFNLSTLLIASSSSSKSLTTQRKILSPRYSNTSLCFSSLFSFATLE